MYACTFNKAVYKWFSDRKVNVLDLKIRNRKDDIIMYILKNIFYHQKKTKENAQFQNVFTIKSELAANSDSVSE